MTEGYADLQCTVTGTGTMEKCKVLSEEPRGYGFRDAALKISTMFKMKPRRKDGRPVGGAAWTTRIRFELGKTPRVELGPSGPTSDLASAPPLSR